MFFKTEHYYKKLCEQQDKELDLYAERLNAIKVVIPIGICNALDAQRTGDKVFYKSAIRAFCFIMALCQNDVGDAEAVRTAILETANLVYDDFDNNSDNSEPIERTMVVNIQKYFEDHPNIFEETEGIVHGDTSNADE